MFTTKLTRLSSNSEMFKRVAPGSKSAPQRVDRDETSVLRTNSSAEGGPDDGH